MKTTKIFKYGVFALLVSVWSCKNTSNKTETVTEQQAVVEYTEEELYRPNFHFTPKDNWMNDPNGMFYLDGVYHLFFQYHPESSKWGPMHWGHAISKDLINWEEQEIALFPDEKGYIFSGSCVVDHNNTSGLGDGETPPVIAMFTYHDLVKEKAEKIDVETQGIAYSLDKGKTWIKYENNPVVGNPGIRDFRDPKVVWDKVHEQWIMVLAAKDRAHFYKSNNLLDWTFLSEFGAELGAHGGVWECPDFFQMEVKGTNETKWVLLQSLNPGGPNGGSATQYFVGDFDGKSFQLDESFEKALTEKDAFWLDYGKDNYAGVTWNNTNEKNPIFIGWMSNWLYAQEVPTERWRSSMTIPRQLKLEKVASGYRLISSPIDQLNRYFDKTIEKKAFGFKNKVPLLTNENIDLSKVVVELELTGLDKDVYTFSLENSFGDNLEFGLDNQKKELFINRKNSGKVDFSDKFSNTISTAPLNEITSKATFKIIIDKTSIEIFFNNGQEVLTEIFFPNQPFQTLYIESSGKEATVNTLKANQININ